MIVYILVLVLTLPLLSQCTQINEDEITFKNETIFQHFSQNLRETKQLKDLRASATTLMPVYDPTSTAEFFTSGVPTDQWTTAQPFNTSTCPRDKFDIDIHIDYVITPLTFPETHVGSQTTSLELCVCDDVPVLRYCFENGTWSDLIGYCCEDSITMTALRLQSLFLHCNPDTDSSYESSSIFVQVNNITQNLMDNFTAFDVHTISRFLSYAPCDENNLDYQQLFDIINNAMNINRTILNSAQELLNTTDTLLYTLDQLLLKSNIKHVERSNFIANTFNTSNGTVGGMMKMSGAKNDCTEFQLEYLYEDDYLDKINTEYFDIAFTMSDVILTTQDSYIVTVFCSENLFNEKKNNTIGSWITSILLSNEIQYTGATITLYFREFDSYSHQQCDYWKYGLENDHPIKGSWRADGNATVFKIGYFICEVNHTTHFAMLVSDTVADSFILDLITIFGSVLSLAGLIIIFLTALVFRQWRKELKTKILLNLSLCLLSFIILFIVSDEVEKGTACIVVGILLHYMVIAQFCWILVTSYYNYKLYVNFNLKADKGKFWIFCLFGWGTPIIVVAIIAGINYETYDKFSEKNSSQICYPKDLYLKLGICLPMSIILAMNSILYFKVLKSLIENKKNLTRDRQENSYVIEKHLVLFFFTMGLTWLFGFLTAFTDFVVFVYLFCTLTTLHGFILFVVYIWEDKRVKDKWRNLITRLFRKNPSERFENQSTTEIDNRFSHFKSEGR